MKKLAAILVLISVFGHAVAQNLPNVEYKRFHFGFSLGLDVLDFGIKNSMVIAPDGKTYQAEVSRLQPGFNVGLIGDVRLCNYLNLRLCPTFYIADRTLTFMNDRDDMLYEADIRSTLITVPLLLKYSAVRIKNYGIYVLAGAGVLFDFSHEQEHPILLEYFDYFVEFGVGCTFYTKYFRLSPEIKFALGFNNIHMNWSRREEKINGGYLDPEWKPYNDALSKLTSRLFTFSLNFE
ncbi:MAG: PorT family protein [Paludibacteraceae bacterium]|nr:PorT family protein [Paludibacteraceae bacterium]